MLPLRFPDNGIRAKGLPPAGAAAAHGHSHLQCGSHKGGRLQGASKERLPAASLQGAARAVASRAGVGDRSGYPRARERCDGSVEVTVGPTMSWLEFMTHGDATI
ncbi:hypothetical protein B296_00028368 [Ensete ventricosum]|uniref:Uncharacterized protein n=1 Tax=Ensete ventricosum TaxID=4639 RepID=A0A427A2B8_ENSVE|nr:hypothetical protein B296_00028368 [Ensete ventricosum]